MHRYQKITFENKVNGFSAVFSSDNPKSLLERFDGSSCGSEAITYRPLDYNGQKFVSSTLTARTIQFAVSFCGRKNGRYSRAAALEKWEELQRVFVPGQEGTLTWTDGINTRFIKCRADSVPLPTEVLPFLFRVEFSMVADNPLWFDSIEHVEDLTAQYSSHKIFVYNPCGIAVPFKMSFEMPAGKIFVMTAGQVRDDESVMPLGGILFTTSLNAGNTIFTIDTAECTVRNSDGELCNQLLNAQSTFFQLAPGEIKFNFGGDRPTECEIRWREAYLSVY